MTAVLWHIELSHYSEKARWALDYKRIPHVRKSPLPGLHGAYAAALTRGRHRRLPILELDGRRVADSTAIIAALEERRPEPPLYPADPDERARALELEDWFDEELAPALRRWVWQHTLGDADATVGAVTGGAPGRRSSTLRVLLPVMRPAVRMDYGVSEEGAARALDAIRTA